MRYEHKTEVIQDNFGTSEIKRNSALQQNFQLYT